MKTLSPQLLSPLLLLVAATLHLLPPSSATTVTKAHASTPAPSTADFIRSVCNNTSYPVLCYSSMSPYAKLIKQSPSALARVGVSVSQPVVHNAATGISGLAGKAKGRDAAAISDCISTLGDASDQISDSLRQLRQIAAGKGGDFNFAMNTVLTEMSSALTNEDTCEDGFENVTEGPVRKKAVDLVTKAKKFTSIALSFVNYYAKKGSP